MVIKKLVALLSVSLGLTCFGLAAKADNNRDDLLQLIRQQDGNRAAMAVDKLITVNFSPDWWQYFLNKDTNAYHQLRILADSMMTYGQNYGGDDIEKLDETHDASSPLVADAIDKLATKAHMTINFTSPVPEKFRATAIHNLDLIGYPMTEKTYCNPRGHKLHVTVTLDPKAKLLGSTVSRDGNDYALSLPAFVGISSSPFEEAFKKGS